MVIKNSLTRNIVIILLSLTWWPSNYMLNDWMSFLKFYCNMQKDITNRYRQLYQRKTSKTTERCCWAALEEIISGTTNQLLYLKAQIPGSTFPNSKCITFPWLGCLNAWKLGFSGSRQHNKKYSFFKNLGSSSQLSDS